MHVTSREMFEKQHMTNIIKREGGGKMGVRQTDRKM